MARGDQPELYERTRRQGGADAFADFRVRRPMTSGRDLRRRAVDVAEALGTTGLTAVHTVIAYQMGYEKMVLALTGAQTRG